MIGNRGFGGNGNPSQGRCVNTGPFRTPGWSITTGACLRRRFNGNVPDAVAVQNCVNINNFIDFELTLRAPLHNNVHVRIGKFLLINTILARRYNLVPFGGRLFFICLRVVSIICSYVYCDSSYKEKKMVNYRVKTISILKEHFLRVIKRENQEK